MQSSNVLNRFALAYALAAVSSSCTSSSLQAEPKLSAVPASGAADKSSSLAVTTIELPRLEGREQGRTLVDTPSATPKALQIGQARRIQETETPALTAARLQWRALANGGRIATLRFTSVGALGIRLGISVLEIPPGTVFRFSSKNRQNALIVSGEEIRRLVQSNLDAGDSGEEARTYWSPDLGGKEATMQVELAPSVNPSALRIYVARLSHIGLASPVPGSRP